MSIEGTKKLGDWGKMIPGDGQSHVTQTNRNSHEGEGGHVTIGIPGTKSKVHDYFDGEGNFLRSDFAKK